MKIIKGANLVKTVHASTFANKKIVADVSIWAYATVTMVGMNFVMYFMSQYQRFKMHGITPIYIFDGPPRECKSETIERRKEMSSKSKRPQPCSDHFEILKSIFTHMNIEWRQAKHETDNLCSELFHSGEVSAGFTRDGDFLAYGIDTLIIKFMDDKMDVIYLADVLALLKMSYDVFVDFCITLGTDYNKNVRGIGPVTALKNAQNGKIVKVEKHDEIFSNFYHRLGIESATGIREYEDINSENFARRLKSMLLYSQVNSLADEIRAVSECCKISITITSEENKRGPETLHSSQTSTAEDNFHYIENF